MTETLKTNTTNSSILTQVDHSWDGKKIDSINIKEPQITVVRISIPKGEKLSLHKHPIINVGFLLKGELTIHTDTGDSFVLKANEPLVEVIDTWHYGENTSDTDVDLVVVYVGDKKDKIKIEK